MTMLPRIIELMKTDRGYMRIYTFTNIEKTHHSYLIAA